MKYFIIAGHDKNGDPGAIAYDKTTEASLTAELRDMIVNKLRGLKVETANGTVMEDNDNEKLWQTINAVNASSDNPRDFLLDIHFNYNAENAFGTEVFYAASTSQENIDRAKELSRLVATILGIPNRGAKPDNQSQHSKLGILSDTKPMALLIEVCFMNEKDLTAYRAKKEIVASRIAMFIFKLK